jgi:hypothetical protein
MNTCETGLWPNAKYETRAQPPHAADPATAFCFLTTPVARGRWCGSLGNTAVRTRHALCSAGAATAAVALLFAIMLRPTEPLETTGNLSPEDVRMLRAELRRTQIKFTYRAALSRDSSEFLRFARDAFRSPSHVDGPVIGTLDDMAFAAYRPAADGSYTTYQFRKRAGRWSYTGCSFGGLPSQ